MPTLPPPHSDTRRVAPAMGLAGRPSLPGDKSIGHRAAVLAALAAGESEIVGLSDADDVASTLRCLEALGVAIRRDEGSTFLTGGTLHPPSSPLDCGNSATTMRLLTGLLAGHPFESTLIGDSSLSRRPMDRIAEPLTRMGADIKLHDDHAPVEIRGMELRGISYELPVPSAQVKSAILLAGLSAEGETVVREPVPSRDHTERMLGLDVLDVGGIREIVVSSDTAIEPGVFVVPRDFSAAACFLVAACIVDPSIVEFKGVGINPTRTGLLDVLRAMGASIKLHNVREHRNEPMADIWVRNEGSRLHGLTIEGNLIPRLIDELPLLAVAAAFAEGTTVVRNAAELRVKESDRIEATAAFLSSMGADIETRPDGWVIQGGRALTGCGVDTHGDHRIAMAAAIAALGASGETVIHDASCVNVSFPEFWAALAELTGEVMA